MLVAYWSFDDGSGSTAADGSGNGHAGTLSYGPSWEPAASCKVGGCVSLDGVDDYVKVTDAVGLKLNGDVTVSASSFSWRVDFQHEAHVHPFLPDTAGSRNGSFTAPTTGHTAADVWYRIYLTVTDSGGLTSTTHRDVMPRTSRLTLAANAAGAQLELDGQAPRRAAHGDERRGRQPDAGRPVAADARRPAARLRVVVGRRRADPHDRHAGERHHVHGDLPPAGRAAAARRAAHGRARGPLVLRRRRRDDRASRSTASSTRSGSTTGCSPSRRSRPCTQSDSRSHSWPLVQGRARDSCLASPYGLLRGPWSKCSSLTSLHGQDRTGWR